MSIGMSKIRGSLYGGAIGDAMGGPLEPFDTEFVNEHFNGSVNTLVDYYPEGPHWYFYGSPKGTYTDDTILKNVLCMAIIAHEGRINASRFARVYVETMKREYFIRPKGQLWPGQAVIWFKLFITLNQPYKEILFMPDARELGQGNLPACDAAMMISPIGLINPGDPIQAALDAAEVSSVLQSGVSATAPSAIAAGVSVAMLPGANVSGVIEAAIQNTDAQTSEKIMQAVELARSCKDGKEFKKRFYEKLLVKTADVLEVVPAAFGILALTGGEYIQTVIQGANFGRDCDTIAGIAGSISGALNGFESLPIEWVEAVQAANPDQPSLDELSNGIFLAILESKARHQNQASLLDKLIS